MSDKAHEINPIYKAGGGSLTAFPVVETQEGDVSAYIPTNVISITDGQIFLESDLFNSGVRPAVNVGISVSRVGGAAQTKAMKKTAGGLRINLAQYRELAAFAQFGSDLDASTRATLTRGEKLVELLKQGQYSPMGWDQQVMILHAGTSGALDDLDTKLVLDFERELLAYMSDVHPEVGESLRTTKVMSDETKATLDAAVTKIKAQVAAK